MYYIYKYIYKDSLTFRQKVPKKNCNTATRNGSYHTVHVDSIPDIADRISAFVDIFLNTLTRLVSNCNAVTRNARWYKTVCLTKHHIYFAGMPPSCCSDRV